MYQIPTWRYWLVAIVVVVSLLLALPNFFGEELAIQLAREDRAAMDANAQQRVQGILDKEKIPTTSAYLEDGRLVLRFAGADEQIRARDAVNEATKGDYVVALTSVSRTPRFLSAVGLKPMSLGLDLRGGVYFMYQVDVRGAIDKALQRLSQDIRTQLRKERIPYLSSVVDGQTVRVILRAGADVAAATKLIQGSDPGMTITNESVGDQVELTVAFTPQRLKERQGLAIEQNITTLRNRVNELGVSEPIVNRQGVDRIVVQLPGVQDPNQAVRVLGATATVEFRLVDEANNPYEAESNKRVPIGSKLYKETDGRPILLKRDVIATGEQLTDATSRFSEGAPEVGVTLDARGGQEMLEATRDNVGRRMAVVYIETKSLAEGESLQRNALRRCLHRGARDQRGDDPERAVVELPHYRAAVGRSARARAAAAFRRAGGAAAHRRATVDRSEPG